MAVSAPAYRPPTALAAGLKVDVDALPRSLQRAIARGKVNLKDPAVTLELLKLDAVVGVTGFFDERGRITSMGIQCALCHSTVDDSFAKGIGHRRDGWANRDLNVGAIIALAPRLEPVAAAARHRCRHGAQGAELLGSGTLRRVAVHRRQGVPARRQVRLGADPAGLRSRGREPAHLDRLGWHVALERVRREPRDARPGNVLRSAARRCHALPDRGARAVRPRARGGRPDHPAAAGAAALPAVAAGADGAARQLRPLAPRSAAKALFNGKAKCGGCHVPPLYTEPGWNMHTGAEIGIDEFQASRSPDGRYRTAPLRGLWTHTTGGFYHDGRFPTLAAVIDHYDAHFSLGLTAGEKSDLAEFLKSL